MTLRIVSAVIEKLKDYQMSLLTYIVVFNNLPFTQFTNSALGSLVTICLCYQQLPKMWYSWRHELPFSVQVISKRRLHVYILLKSWRIFHNDFHFELFGRCNWGEEMGQTHFRGMGNAYQVVAESL
jgi:hypothetical protein